MKDINIVTKENLHISIVSFIEKGNHIIGEYEDMKELILNMIREGYVFNLDRDRLRDAMEELTYMLCPGDDVNKDRLIKGLEYDDSSDEEDIRDDLEDDSEGDLEDDNSVDELTIEEIE